jgi:hypothetical protein
MSQPDLLGQLRIDRDARPQAPAPRAGVPWWLFVGALLLVGGGAWWLSGGRQPSALKVQTALAQAAASVPTSASVLDASGYVTRGARPRCRPRSPARCARC